MHRAPAVNFPVKRSRWQALLVLCVSLLALATVIVFAWEQKTLDLRIAVLTLSIFAASSMALVGWKSSPQGNLRWDGEFWHWSGFQDNPVCRLGVLMDFQSVVVVHINTEARAPVYLWLEVTSGGSGWQALRRAIVSGQAAVGGKGKSATSGIAGELA